MRNGELRHPPALLPKQPLRARQPACSSHRSVPWRGGSPANTTKKCVNLRAGVRSAACRTALTPHRAALVLLLPARARKHAPGPWSSSSACNDFVSHTVLLRAAGNRAPLGSRAQTLARPASAWCSEPRSHQTLAFTSLRTQLDCQLPCHDREGICSKKHRLA